MLTQRESDVIEHRHIRKQRSELKQHSHLSADAVQRFEVGRIQPFSVNKDLSFIRRQQTSDKFQKGCLAHAGAAHNGNHFALTEG